MEELIQDNIKRTLIDNGASMRWFDWCSYPELVEKQERNERILSGLRDDRRTDDIKYKNCMDGWDMVWIGDKYVLDISPHGHHVKCSGFVRGKTPGYRRISPRVLFKNYTDKRFDFKEWMRNAASKAEARL
jgi:hypothetical protein